MNKFAIVTSCAVFASGAVLAQYPAPATREAPPAAAPVSAVQSDFSPGAIGKPARTVGGGTRSVNKVKAPEATDAGADNKTGDFSPGSVGKPTKTVGGGTRGANKEKASEATDAGAGNKTDDAKAVANLQNDKK